jgi:hypothetical protein
MKKILLLTLAITMVACSKESQPSGCGCQLVKESTLYNPATGFINPWQQVEVINPNYSTNCALNNELSNNQSESLPNTTMVRLTRYKVKCN